MLLDKDQISKLLKEEILNELPKSEVNDKVLKMKKVDLIDRFVKYLGESKIKHNRIIKKYNEKFSLHPSKLEELLGITKTERLRWTEEGKLNVQYYDSFYKWGQSISVPMFSFIETTKLIKSNKIDKWRKEHQKKITNNKKNGGKKASKTKTKHQSLIQNFYENEWKELIIKWYDKDVVAGATLQLAYWTTWVNRYAKEMQIKSRNVIKKTEEYNKKKDYFYELKERALKSLMRSPISTIEFYKPQLPDKISNLQFCDYHYHQWVMDREFDYIPKWDFFWMNEKSIRKCNNCSFDTVKDYYSLYYLSVSSGDFRFSFHTPYPIGRDIFPDKKELNKVSHQEQEGIFRFGRSLFEEEKIIFNEKKIEKYFKEALNNYNEKVLPGEKEIATPN